jgi:hypothetical protein
MLIATFGPGTGWAGKTITREGDVFTLEGHGSITPADVMGYDRQGHLVWVNDGTRAWVGAKASATPASPPQQVVPATSFAPDSGTAQRPEVGVKPVATVIISRRLLIIVGIVALVVLGIGAIALFLPRFSATNGADSVQSSPTLQWVKAMTVSGAGTYKGLPHTSSPAFELSGSEQRLEYTLSGSSFVAGEIWVISTAGPDSGHSDPVVQRTGATTQSVTLYKDPGRYTIEVGAHCESWTVTLYDKR